VLTEVLVGLIEIAGLPVAHEQSMVTKEASMFILASFILAYQYHRTDTYDFGYDAYPFETWQPLCNARASLAGLQMANDGVRRLARMWLRREKSATKTIDG
jgi:hypothetical protein